MSEAINTTALLAIGKRIKLAKRGHSLLQKKQKILVNTLMKTVAEYKKFRTNIIEQKKQAYKALALENAYTGMFITRSVAYGTRQMYKLNSETKNIMGVHLPEYSVEQVRKDTEFHKSPQLLETSRNFHSLFELLVKLHSLRESILRLTEEITKVKRRVNSLEYIQIPKMEKQKAFIRLALDERERDAFVSIKETKKRLAQ
jgi:V/A-type H+-transporting ATPase subunit D